MGWKQFGFFRRWDDDEMAEMAIEREQTVIKVENEMLETTDLIETEVSAGVEVSVEKPSINHAKLFVTDIISEVDQKFKNNIARWFTHLRLLNNLETDDQLENHIWELGGKPNMVKDLSVLTMSYMDVHYAKMAIFSRLSEYDYEISQRVVFELNSENEWIVTVDSKTYPVRFGNLPQNHDVMPHPFYIFKNNKAIMHVITVDGVVSILLNRDYQIIKALSSDGNSIDKFVVDRSGNVLALLMVTTTLADLVNKSE